MARAPTRGLRLVIAALLLAACGRLISATPPTAVPAEPPSAALGRVLGEEGQPVAGAEIEIRIVPAREAHATEGGAVFLVSSADDGTFPLPSLPPGEVVLRATAPSGGTAWFRGSLQGAAPAPEIRVPRGRSLRVRVEDAEGRPVPLATVGLFPEPRRMMLSCYPMYLRMESSATTEIDGTCTLHGLGQRLYRVAAFAEGAGLGAVTTTGGASEARVVLGMETGHRRFKYMGLPEEVVPPDSLALERGPPPDPPPPDDALGEPTPTPPDPEEPTPVPPGAEEEPTEPDRRARLVARVISADGVPVPRADVTLQWAEDPDRARSLGQGSAGPEQQGFEFTDPDGRACLLLEPGRYDLTAGSSDVGTPEPDGRAVVEVGAGDDLALDVRLPTIFSVTIETMDAIGQPLPDVRLEVLRGEERTQEWTRPDGRTTLFADRHLPFRVLVRPDGIPVVDSGLIALPVEGPVVLRVPRSETIRGRVVDPAGVPLFGVEVGIRREGLTPPAEEEWTARTDDRGEFALTGPSAGAYTVEAQSHAFRATAQAGVRVPGTATVEIRLRMPVRIRGRILGADGEPLADAFIDGGGRREECVASRLDGTFDLDWREQPDAATLFVSAEGHRTREVSVVLGNALPLEIRLEREP